MYVIGFMISTFFFCSCKLLPCFEVSLDVGYTLLLREVSLVSFNTAHI